MALITSECVKSAHFRREVVRELNIDFTDLNWRDRLGQKMWDLNQLALGCRYGDKKLHLKYFYSDVSRLLAPVQLFKSLQCWMYQCTEGDIPKKSKLYKVFREKIISQMAVSIVQNLPEYDEADWA